jgi:hypothetical protein
MISFRTVGKAHSHAAEPDSGDFQVEVSEFALLLLFSFRLCTFTPLSAAKQIEVAFDTIVSLGWANRFFIRKVISVCHVWTAENSQ